MKKRLVSWLGALAVAVTMAAVGSAQPAQAAEPTCNTYGNGWLEQQAWGIYVPLYNGNYRCKLNPGDGVGGWNGGVVGLQKNLNRCARQSILNSDHTDLEFSTLAEDGEFGPNTKSALIKTQKYLNRERGAGIATDGGYGPQTRKWMDYWSSTSGCGNLGQP